MAGRKKGKAKEAKNAKIAVSNPEDKPMQKTPKHKPSKKDSGKSERKTEANFILLVVFVLAIFGVIIIGAKIFTKQKVTSIETLHEMNIAGKLDPDKGFMYNSFSFVNANQMWFTKIKNLEQNRIYNIQLHFNPRQVENISIDGDIMQFSEFNGTYFTFDPIGSDLPHVAVAGSELSINLGTFFGMGVLAACTRNETEACQQRGIITCENNDQNPIIYIEEAAEPRIIQKSNCIRIQGNGFDLIRGVDKLLYVWMGIMPQ